MAIGVLGVLIIVWAGVTVLSAIGRLIDTEACSSRAGKGLFSTFTNVSCNW